MSKDYSTPTPEQTGLIGRLLRWCLENKLVVGLFVMFIVGWGLMVAPFDIDLGSIPRDPVATDAIPDIGENQQIVFTKWAGRSPQDVEDQISYPLTTALLGVPGIKTIRSSSMFGFSSIYIIFKEFSWSERFIEGKDFYWTRSRVLEKLNSLPPGTLPEGVQPRLGPDATALGQVYWYTLEGRDPDGKPAGGWDLEELRTIQDWIVRYALLSADGVAEIASVGGFQREYQIDVDPDAMRAHNVTLPEVYKAVKASNIDVGAGTIEVNRVEYFVRGIGFIKSPEDIEHSVVKVNDNVSITIKDVATVTIGPASRRGVLDKDGAEAVGGVVVARYGDNPLRVIKNLKGKIDNLAPGLPTKVVIDHSKVSEDELRRFAREHGFDAYAAPGKLNHEAWKEHLRKAGEARPDWVTTSHVTIVPFYDRTGLIYETLGTLRVALEQEILITFIVVILMVMHLRSSVLIGGMLPLTVLMCFVAMKTFGVDANIVALSGIAIAIGTIVDMGIVVCENILRHLESAPPEVPRLEVIHRGASEVGGAVLTAVATTIVSFLPVFAMTAAEGKLFKPLAFTKTFALLSSIIIALTVIPAAAHILFCAKLDGRRRRLALFAPLTVIGAGLIIYGLALASMMITVASVALTAFAIFSLLKDRVRARLGKAPIWIASGVVVLLVGLLLSRYWEPLGPERGGLRNFIFVAVLVGVLLGFFKLFQAAYKPILQFCLAFKAVFLAGVAVVLVLGFLAWGTLGKEFMPPLDEGSFLYMPTTMVHASIGEATDVLSKQDKAFRNLPEVESVGGKVGRADSPLDPAPVSMIETVINYKPKYKTDKNGKRIKYKHDPTGKEIFKDAAGKPLPAGDGLPYYVAGRFERDADGKLVPDPDGLPFRQWRPPLDPKINSGREAWEGIKSPDDIWDQIILAGDIPGATSAPRLQPIKARLVMLQSGMRAPMGVKVMGPDLETIEKVGLDIERLLKQVPSVEPAAVIADRIIGKPYLNIIPDRWALKRYGIDVRRFQDVIEIALGGRTITQTVMGRERFRVRVRYQRELRDTPEAIERILVSGSRGEQIPLSQLATIEYVRGPQVLKSEDTFLVGYVLFDMKPGHAEVDVVEECKRYLAAKEAAGEFTRPPGVKITFAGSYENQQRAQQRLMLVVPIALFFILLILYFQFKSFSTSLLVFSGIFVAWAGGFMLLWLYGQGWFLNFSVFDVNMRELFQVHPINLSVAVWVGFLALFGIASDNGVIQSTYLDQVFRDRKPASIDEIRQATVIAAQRRVRPCLMTSATTILALIPILTSVGRGSDVMVPMAIPSFGGMLVVLISIFFVPVLYCGMKEVAFKFSGANEPDSIG